MYSAEDLYADDGDGLDIIQEGDQEQIGGNSDDDNNQGDQAEEAEEDGEQKDKKVVKPKKVVRNPQPKLDIEALKGKRGLLALQEHFKNVKFKGRGHEEEDLRKIMKTYEYWCHRLFPKYPFDQCIAQFEKLGTKKSVQVYVKKIRLDMLFDDKEPTLNDSDEEGPNQQTANEFDELLSQNTQGNNISDTAVNLTDDQLERIRLNREKAMKLRKDRLKAAQAKAFDALASQPSSSSSQLENISSTSRQNIANTQNSEEEISTTNVKDSQMQTNSNEEDTNEDDFVSEIPSINKNSEDIQMQTSVDIGDTNGDDIIGDCTKDKDDNLSVQENFEEQEVADGLNEVNHACNSIQKQISNVLTEEEAVADESLNSTQKQASKDTLGLEETGGEKLIEKVGSLNENNISSSRKEIEDEFSADFENDELLEQLEAAIQGKESKNSAKDGLNQTEKVLSNQKENADTEEITNMDCD